MFVDGLIAHLGYELMINDVLFYIGILLLFLV